MDELIRKYSKELQKVQIERNQLIRERDKLVKELFEKDEKIRLLNNMLFKRGI